MVKVHTSIRISAGPDMVLLLLLLPLACAKVRSVPSPCCLRRAFGCWGERGVLLLASGVVPLRDLDVTTD